MNILSTKQSNVVCLTFVLSLFGLQLSTQAQPTYSIDSESAGISFPALVEGDILTPQGAGVIPPPAVAIPQSLLGYNYSPLGGELDALSYGTDPLLLNTPGVKHNWSFSVDEFAVGRAGVPFPSVSTEGAFGAQEAAGDIYSSVQNPGPFPPYFGSNAGIFDGNGGASPFLAPGLNLREPTFPTVNMPDAGDNLDAWDIDQAAPQPIPGQTFAVPVYFSLDSIYTDPLDFNNNTGSAIANGFSGGDVLVTYSPGGPAVLFAPATLLGLDQNGSDHDDLDALVLWENGDGFYTPTTGPYSWVGGQTDMLLFSVRRGSAIIGQIDPLLGLPIEEGDILVPMGTSGQTPGIFVPAEALGLVTVRTDGLAATFQGYGDDLDALDVLQIVPEPATCSLLIAGLLGITCRRRRL